MTVRAVVTGANGLLGRSIFRALADRRHSVIALGRTPFGDDFRHADLTDADEVATGITDVDCVVHAAGKTGRQDGGDANERMARALSSAVRSEQLILNLSSVAVYGDVDQLVVDETTPCAPVSDYGQSKRSAEELLDQRGPNTCHLRIGNVFDADRFAAIAASPRQRLIRANEASNLVFVEDVADVCVQLAERFAAGRPVPPVLNVVRPDLGARPLHRIIGPAGRRGLIHRKMPSTLPHLLRSIRRIPSLPNRTFVSSVQPDVGVRYRPVDEVAPDSWHELVGAVETRPG